MDNGSNMFTVIPKLFAIKIVTGSQRALAQTVYFTKDLPINLRIKYDWYFKYREALVRIQNPKNYTEITFVAYDAPKETIDQIELKRSKDKLRAAKAKLTKIENRMKLFKSEYNSLFPIQEDPIYIELLWYKIKAERDLDKLLNVAMKFI